MLYGHDRLRRTSGGGARHSESRCWSCGSETERPEAVAAGTAKLAGVEKDVIVSMASELLENPEAYARMAKAVNPYGDGHASARIADAILWHFGLREGKPADFCAE